MPAVARVLCDASGPDRTFDYLIPAPLIGRVAVGSIVRVDLHGRRIGGWVVALDPEDAHEIEHLLPLRRLSGHGPFPDVVKLAYWAAYRWAGRPSQFLRSASPPRAVPTIPEARLTSIVPEPRSPGTARLIGGHGGVLRLPPGSDVLPAVWSALVKGPVLLIAPGVDDVAILAGRLRRAGVTVAVLPDEWNRAAGGVDVSIGTRSAVFASVPSLGSIVVIDEHDERLQSESSPTWHAREVAIERARRAEIPAVLVSSVPTPEARHGRVLEAPERDREIAGWPRIVVVDPTVHDGPTRGRVSSELLAEVRNRDRRVLCITNTPGRSGLLACRQCRDLARCESCEATMVQHADGELGCRRCGGARPAVCASCGAGAFINLRPGAARIAKELEAASSRHVQLIERDASPHWDDAQATGGISDVFVGTEAVLHRVRSADTVVFLDIDSELFAPRFRAGQQVLSLAALAASVVGGRRANGLVIIQSSTPSHPLLMALAAADPGRAGEIETTLRQDLQLPPFGGLAIVEGAGAGEFVDSLPATVRVGGDAERRQVRAESASMLSDALSEGRRPSRGRLRVAVEPAR